MPSCNDNGTNKLNNSLFYNRIWMNSEEAAAYLKISAKSLRNMTSNGSVTYYKLGKRNRYLKNDLDALLLQNQRGGSNGH